MPPSTRLVRLDEADAQNFALVGAKAGRIARARAQGLPVLNGLVVPTDVSAPIIRAGEAALAARGNSGAARTAVYNHPAPSSLSELADEARQLGDALVVRSSSPAEVSGIWAGAFSSYIGLHPEEVAMGVVGCWASLFNPDALRRASVAGVKPSEVGMAVLIQPAASAIWGGVATLGDDGAVRVAATSGHPAGIVGGWENGQVTVVNQDGTICRQGPSPPDVDVHRTAADLTRKTWERIGCDHIEWLLTPGRKLYLLQAQLKSDMQRMVDRRVPHPPSTKDPRLGAVVRMMIRYPGPMGERWVWPWAIGIDHLSPAGAAPTNLPRSTLVQKIHTGAARLQKDRWGTTRSVATVEQAWSELRNGDSSTMMELVSRHPSVDLAAASALLRKLQDLAHALCDTGAIPRPDWMWRIDPDTLHQPPDPVGSPVGRTGIGLWDPFIYGVIASLGETVSGYPAAGGWGAGRLRLIRNADDVAWFSPRDVIATSLPIGNLAPLLWNAAGLITEGGSPGAHLFEVAEWLGVPAVCGVDVGKWIGDTARRPGTQEDPIVAVDGNLGRVVVLC